MSSVVQENLGPFTNFANIEWETVSKSTRFKSEKAKRLYNWWSSFQPLLPNRSAFDIIDHIEDASNIFLFEAIDDHNFIYRVTGEEVKRIVGKSLLVGENLIADGSQEQYALINYLRQVCETGNCHKCVGGVAISNTRHTKFESIDCPLLGDDGKVQYILGMIELLEE